MPRQNERSHATLLCLMAINMTYRHRGAMGFCGNYNLRPLRARVYIDSFNCIFFRLSLSPRPCARTHVGAI